MTSPHPERPDCLSGNQLQRFMFAPDKRSRKRGRADPAVCVPRRSSSPASRVHTSAPTLPGPLMVHSWWGIKHDSRTQGVRLCALWWTIWGSNPRPQRCERCALPRGTVICATNRGVKMSKSVVKNQKYKKNSVCPCNIKGCSLLKIQHIGRLFFYGISILGM